MVGNPGTDPWPTLLGLLLLGLLGLTVSLGGSACGGEPLSEGPTPKIIPHGPPNESDEAQETCVACHACGVDGAPIIDRTHDTCTECHGPPPDFATEPKEDGGGCGFKMDCTKDPPEVNCFSASCHAHTIRETNAMCEECHTY